MLFKTAFIAHVPDAEPEKHRVVLETELYKLIVCLVKNNNQAMELVNDLVDNEGIHSILLCPGFSNEAVADISRIAGSEVGVAVARGDGAASKIAKSAMVKAGWFDRK